MAAINLSGLASGFDWTSFVNQMVAAEQAPEAPLRTEQSTLNQRKNAYGSIQTELNKLSAQMASLQEAAFFNTRLAQSSDSTVATASAVEGTALGQHTFKITQLATASAQVSPAKLGAALNPTSNVSTLVLSSAAFTNPVTAGTFTVNGQQITLATSDNLQQVFDRISTNTGGAVTGSYDPITDQITFSSAGEIVLGSATDTSNFLLAAKLHNNGIGTVTSSSSLGAVQLPSALGEAHLAAPVFDGGTTPGEFKINGVSITFSATNDSLSNVIDRINNSAAGVTASYDTLSDRLVLTNKTTGDMGMALEDVTGNFLAATGLSRGTLQRGNDLLYTVNGSGQLVSHSNTITADSSGLTGLSVTVSNTGTTTVQVSSDTATLNKAINDFVDQYNKIQSLIDTDTASSADATGKVTAGILANDGGADEIASQLRRLVNSPKANLSSGVNSLNDLGIISNGYDNKLQIGDASKLASALANNLSGVQALFTDATNGLATQLSSYLKKTIGEDGTLVAKQNDLTQQSRDIDTQIANMERLIQQDKQRMIAEFTAMEAAEATINQQLSYLNQTFGGSSSASKSA